MVTVRGFMTRNRSRQYVVATGRTDARFHTEEATSTAATARKAARALRLAAARHGPTSDNPFLPGRSLLLVEVFRRGRKRPRCPRDYVCGCISPRYGITCPATTSMSKAIV